MKRITNVKELQDIVFKLEKFKLSELGGKIIIGYLVEHNYEILTDENSFFLLDTTEQEDIEKLNFKGILDTVQCLNSLLIEDTEYEIENLHPTLDQHEKFEKLMKYLYNLKDDETKLDNLYKVFTTLWN